MKELNITHNGEIITFILIRKNVKNINLRVKVTGEIIVTANPRVEEEYIIDFLKRKMPWIIGHREKFKERREAIQKEKDRTFEDGIWYLGKIYKVRAVKSEKEYVKRGKDEIYVFLKDKDNERRVNILLNKWYRERCIEIFTSIYGIMFKKFGSYMIPHVDIKVRKMKSRWGSCNPVKKRVTLNSELMKTPMECIEFVIAHELAHLVEANHSKAFYEVLTRVMPDWKERKEILNKFYL